MKRLKSLLSIVLMMVMFLRFAQQNFIYANNIQNEEVIVKDLYRR